MKTIPTLLSLVAAVAVLVPAAGAQGVRRHEAPPRPHVVQGHRPGKPVRFEAGRLDARRARLRAIQRERARRLAARRHLHRGPHHR